MSSESITTRRHLGVKLREGDDIGFLKGFDECLDERAIVVPLVCVGVQRVKQDHGQVAGVTPHPGRKLFVAKGAACLGVYPLVRPL